MGTKRGLIKASGILYIIGAIGFLLITLGLYSMGETLIQEVDKLLAEMVLVGELMQEDADYMMSALESFLTTMPFIIGVVGVVELVVGINLVLHSNAPDEDILNKKGWVIIGLIIALLSGGIIVAILLLIALFKKGEQKVNYSPAQTYNNNGGFSFSNEPKMDSNLQSIFKRPEETTTTTEPNILNNFGASNSNTQTTNTQNTSVTNSEYEDKIKRLQQLRDSGAISQEEYITLLKQTFKD